MAIAPFVVAGTFALAAGAAAGSEPGQQQPIQESVVRPVSPLPSAVTHQPELEAVRDPWAAPPPAGRPQPSLRAAKPIVVSKPRPEEQPDRRVTAERTGESIAANASWYCRAGRSPCTNDHPDGPGFDAYAAAGPELREAIGPGWRGNIVWVDGIRVKLIDWCQCYRGEPHEKLLDLYYDVYERVGTRVTVRW